MHETDIRNEQRKKERADEPLTDFSPLYRETGRPALQKQKARGGLLFFDTYRSLPDTGLLDEKVGDLIHGSGSEEQDHIVFSGEEQKP